uniref:Putative dehydrogenase n=1 Tax=Triatoma infestans TaxID=30076 RepID=A0A023F714_TRIIF
MDRWKDRVAVVTGASAGIGEAIARALAEHGMKVAALARRLDRLQKLEEEGKHMLGTLKAYKCDCSNETEIASTMQNILADLGPISVLINNAAILAPMTLTDTSQGLCRKLYETNVIGLVTFTQHAVEMMKKHDISDGHIININSICGHSKLHAPGIGNYCASKNMVTVLTESLKNELACLKSNIRITSISPGLVLTEMIDHYPIRGQWPQLKPEDIVEGIVFALSVKANINVSELTIEPTGGIRGAFVKE